MAWKRREAPILIASFVIFVLTFNFFIYTGPTSELSLHIQKSVGIIFPFGMFVGGIMLILHNIKKISKRGDNWVDSVVLLATLFISLILTSLVPGFFDQMNSVLYIPIGATVKAFLGLYIIGAAYRTFTIRNLDSVILVLASIIVMIGTAPSGGTLWKGFPIITNWLIVAPTMGVTRGIMIGASIAAIVFTLRVFLGKQKGIAGGD